MSCPSCGRASRPGARYCGGCGRALAPRCPACGIEAEAGARFCDACGAPFAVEPGDPGGTRKVVTIVFADLAGSTALHERLDAESTRRFMDRYYRAMQRAVDAHGGIVTQLLGDGVKAVFGAPRVAEDDALRAVRAAVGMQAAFRELAAEQAAALGALGLRVAVHTGEVVARDETEIIGDPVNVAARLQQEARDGDVIVGDSTRRLVGELVTLESFGTFALKGRAEPVRAWRVVSLERPARAAAVAFVGRETELGRLLAILDDAVAAPAARLAVVLGSPGLGKSRLLAELAGRLGERACVLTARCDAAGGATFAPIADALRAWLGVDGAVAGHALREAVARRIPGDASDRDRITDGVVALLGGTPPSPEETFFAVRRLLAALAELQPVVLALDDLHWAEPLLLDLAEHLVQWGAGAPLLVVAAARPELRDVRSSLATPGGLVADVVTLGGLDAGAATRLAADVVGADELPATIAGRVLATSEGNPLFVGELVRMLVHDGVLKHERGRWTAAAEVAALEMPPTIHALLAARIERLRPEERSVLERAAVVGRHFSRGAVAELLSPEARADLDARLEGLRRSELVEADRGWLLGEPALRFHHALIRDAAYRRVLKGTRAELHARLADWLEARVGEGVEHEETIGWHLEQAHQHLRELGPIDAAGRAVGERAARHLAAAGRRALARDDLPLAAGLLGRALDRLDPADSARAELALDWCEALLAAGEVGLATEALDELDCFAARSERLRAWHVCFAGQHAVLTDPQALRATSDAVAAAAEALASAGDAAGEAKAHSVHALALVRLGRVGAAEAALDRALAAARRAGDRRRANAVLAGAPLAALWGPSPVTRASGRCLDVVRVLRITHGAPAVESVALRCQAVLEALRGRTDAARRMVAASRRMVEELGIAPQLLEADVFAGHVELLDGDAAAAERSLRAAYDGLRERGLGIDAARAAALLGRGLLAQGRAAEAETLSHESESLAGDDLQAAIAWRGVRAEALARRGEHAAAIDLARAAVDLAETTDALLDHADARLALAAALRAAGRGAEADAEERRAIELWDAKGATLLSERARGGVARADAAVARRDPGQHGDPARHVRCRVRENSATRNAGHLDAAVTTRDAEALERIFALGATAVNHPTGTRWERAGSLTLLRGLFGAWDLHLRNEPLATLGDRLALCRSSLSFSELANEALGPFGSVERESVVLVEVDARGERTRTEFFATDHLGDAIARLYERHAELLPDGPARVRAVAIARTVAALLGPPDLERWAAVLAPGLEFTDPRNVGLGTVVVGAEPLLRSVRVLMELSYDFGIRVDDVLDLRPDVLLVRWTTHGRDRASGGAFERNLCQLWVFGPGGRLARWEQSDGDAVEEALARFDALVGDPRVRSIENAATRSAALSGAAWRDRDWERLASLFAPGFRLVDRRTLSHIDLDREQHLENLRLSFAMDSSRYQSDVLATRGERHALSRLVWSGGRLAGPSEIEWLEVAELDERGRFLRIVTFEQQDVDAAFAELDARYAATAANGHARVSATMRAFREAFAERDWQKLEAQFTPDLVVHDHRRLGWETLRGPAAYVDAMRSLVDLAPDVRLRLDHVRTCDRGLFWVARWLGTREGGRFEAPWITVCRHDEQGRVQRFDQYDLDQLDAALARYTELVTRPPQGPRIENTATRAMERVGNAWRARDAAALAGLAAPGFRNLDRRRIVATDLDRDRFLESFGRVLLEASRAQFWSQVLATRGDRAALVRVCIETSGEIDGPSEFELLQIIEVDAAGRIVAGFGFDPDALDAAFTELDGRYGDPEMAALLRDVHARDWDAVAARLAPDLVVVDHRRLGFEPQRGPAAFVAWIRSLIELAPDARLRVEHAEERDGRRLASASVAGTRHGGRFELAHAVVTVLDERRCIRRMDLYDRDQHELARARFVGVAPGGAGDSLAARARPDVMSAEDGDAIGDPRFGALRPDPARVEANAASHATERLAELVTGGGWPVLRALATSDFRFEDRRRRALVSGDVELYIRNMEWVLSWQGRRVEREILASMGDRISLDRIAWSGEVEGSTIEGEFIRLIEVDADGRPRAVIHFDPEDRDAAFEEAHARRAGRESRAGAARPREACGPEAAAATSERPRAGVLVGFRVILHEGVVHEAVRPALADGIRRAYAALFEIPAASVNVDFTELARGRFFTAGRPSTSSIVAGTVPAGTSTELRHRLLAEITNLWCETTGCTPHEIVVTAGNAPR